MAKIVQMTENGEQLYPLTSVEAVVDENGDNIKQYTDNINNKISGYDSSINRLNVEINKKQETLIPGEGISISENVISAIGVFIVVDSLPEIGDEGKVYIVPNTSGVYVNNYVEYIYTNNKWEILGEYTPPVKVEGYISKMSTLSLRYNWHNSGLLEILNDDNTSYESINSGIIDRYLTQGTKIPVSITHYNNDNSELHIVSGILVNEAGKDSTITWEIRNTHYTFNTALNRVIEGTAIKTIEKDFYIDSGFSGGSDPIDVATKNDIFGAEKIDVYLNNAYLTTFVTTEDGYISLHDIIPVNILGEFSLRYDKTSGVYMLAESYDSGEESFTFTLVCICNNPLSNKKYHVSWNNGTNAYPNTWIGSIPRDDYDKIFSGKFIEDTVYINDRLLRHSDILEIGYKDKSEALSVSDNEYLEKATGGWYFKWNENPSYIYFYANGEIIEEA